MKQYKFKCPIEGCWNDIRENERGSWYACGGWMYNYNKEFYEYRAPTLQKLLKLLRDRNIEIAEVCDRLRWKHLPEDESYCERYESQAVLANDKTFVYTIIPLDADCFEVICNDAPLNGRGCPQSEVSLKAAKAACQADFQKRRAR